jgi:ribosomal protein L13E
LMRRPQARAGSGAMRPADAAPILRQLAERQASAAERVARTLQTAPEPPVGRLSQVFTADELREAGLPARSTAREFRMRWESQEPEAVQVVRDLVASQVDHVTVARRVQRGRGFDPMRVQVVWRR